MDRPWPICCGAGLNCVANYMRTPDGNVRTCGVILYCTHCRMRARGMTVAGAIAIWNDESWPYARWPLEPQDFQAIELAKVVN